MRAVRFVVLLVAFAPVSARAQTNLQLWGNVMLDWPKGERMTWEVDFEPKSLLKAPEGEPGWGNLDVTPNVEYAARGWLDLVGEVATGYTKQTDDVNTWELTPRVGVRFHLFSRGLPTRALHMRELPPKRKVVLRDLLRVESRNMFYTGAGSGSDSSVRFRNRLELLVPLNRERLTDDGARYLLADWEWFMPAGAPAERFANRQRIRLGVGYRQSARWRFEGIYMWTRSRNTIEDDFKTADNIVDIRVKRIF